LSDQKNYTLENQDVGGSFQTPVLEDDGGSFHAFSGVNQDDGTFTGRGGSNAEQSQTKEVIFGSNIRQLSLTAGFSANVVSGESPLEVVFTSNVTGTPTRWFWDFGDGQYSRLENPTHTYEADGTYTVRLTATNASGGDVHEEEDYITVSGVPPLVEVFQDTFLINAPLDGLAPELGGAAWASPFVNLEPEVSGGVLTGLVGFGADGTSLLTYDPNPLNSLSAASRIALRLSFPDGLAIPTGGASAETASVALAVMQDPLGPNEDTVVYLEIIAIGAGTTVSGFSNTIVAQLIVPGVGLTAVNLTSGSNYIGSQVFELIMDSTDGSWSLTRNGTEIAGGSGYTTGFGSTDTAHAYVILNSPTTGPAVTISEVAVLEG